MDNQVKDYGSKSEVFEPISSNNAKQRISLIEWLNGFLPDLSLPVNASDEELRAFLVDGTVLCRLLNKFKPEYRIPSSQSRGQNVQAFLSAMDEMGLPRFHVADLEKGSMKIVLDCLLTLQTHVMLNIGKYNGNETSSRLKLLGRLGSVGAGDRFMSSPPFGEERRSRSMRASGGGLRSPRFDPRSPRLSATIISHAGHKFHEVFQLKQGSYTDLPAARISEMMKSNSLDNAPTQSLLSVVNGILDESIEMKNGEIPHRVACLLRKVVQEIERRICTQAEHLRTQNNLFKAREDKYQSRIRVLEALATGTSEETQIVMNQLQQIKSDKSKIEDKKIKVEDHDMVRVMREKDELNKEIASLKLELERIRISSQEESSKMEDKDEFIQEIASLKQELERVRRSNQEESSKTKDKDEAIQEIESLKQELERVKRSNQEESSKMKDKDEANQEIESLKQELERVRRSNQEESSKMKDKDEVIQEITSLKQELERVRRSSEEDESAKTNTKDEVIQEIASLKQELERVRRSSEEDESSKSNTKDVVIQEISNLRQELKEKDDLNQEIAYLTKEKDNLNQEMLNLKKELETARRSISEVESSAIIKGSNEANREIENLRQEIAVLQRTLEKARATISEEESLTKTKDEEMAKLQRTLEKARATISEEESLTKTKDEEMAKLRQEIVLLKKEVEISKRSSEEESSKLMNELNREVGKLKEEVEEKEGVVVKLRDEVKERENVVAKLRDEVKEIDVLNAERAKLRDEAEKATKAIAELESKVKESRTKVKEVEAASEAKSEWWNKKQKIYHIFTEFQLGALRELRFASQSIQQEVTRTQTGYSDEFTNLGSRIKILGDAAKNYYPLLAENRKMHNELQELKGNIRVYCRVRPFIGGSKGKQSIVDYIGENGELIVANPAKAGKEGKKPFNFDKVYGPASTQAQVYTDTQPLIQSVLDGYNVCIFAYGQTGSGKTYTMTGPDGASEEEWGVNYRALNDLFNISESRQGVFKYEVSVQMVEIYNEQVRDLLSTDGTKKLGVLSTSQPSGLAVPDACIQVVTNPKDVVKLMETGLNNRAKSSTAMNERSSRSHSIVSIHTRGSDLKSGSSLRGSLHLVDLAGSERVDRSEVTGDRLKEAQHINKSLSALGDVIFALAQKSSHVPYRNSKLTQVLQSSLGGRAKTLMFVQLNPDATSFGETLSTLKFAERVSGVELGAAKSTKDGRDVRELMEQVASLKDTIAKKDEEIEALQVVKDPKSGGGTAEKRSTTTLRTEPEGSAQTLHVPDDAKSTKHIDTPKSTSRVPGTLMKSARESAKISTGLRKPPSVTNSSTKSSRK